jgi:hypothetical protein
MASLRFHFIACSTALAAGFVACGGNVILDSPGSGASASGRGGGASGPGVGGAVVNPGVGPSGGGGPLGGGTVVGGSGANTGFGGGPGGSGPAAVTVAVATSTVSVATSTSTTSGMTSSGMSCSSMAPLNGPCTPKAACPGSTSACLALAPQNGASKFGLRMSQLDILAPQVLTQGVVATVFSSAVTPNDLACNLTGTGTFSWLLQFDTNAGTLTTGGAAPSSNPAVYAFLNETLTQGGNAFSVSPVTLSAPFTGCSVESTAGDVVLPVFLDAAGSQVVLLPMHSLAFHGGTVSADHSCIGVYNGASLDPANSCQPNPGQTSFVDGASVSADILLEDADTVMISALNESLCVLLSGNATMYGTPGPNGETVCKRNAANQIVFQGDWCSGTNSPANGGCSDAVGFHAHFAASGVTIK